MMFEEVTAMYADHRHRSSAIDPRSLTIAVAITGSLIGALMFSQPAIKILDPYHPFKIYQVPLDPPPPPKPQKPIEHPRTQSQPIHAPKPIIELPKPTDPIPTKIELPQPTPLPSASGTVTVPDATPSPALVTIGAEIDPAHKGDLQPTYPPSELRAEREGSVTVRVLIGVDGRVHEVQQVSATSDAFFRATQDQALRRWRFRPATRGSVPIESWRQMTIRFVIPH